KPHGAFYMQAMEDKKVARAILEAIHDIDKETIVFAVNNSEMMEEARKVGIPVAREGYADREHTKDGSLVVVRKGETIEYYEEMAQRFVRMVRDTQEITFDTKDVSIEGDKVYIAAD